MSGRRYREGVRSRDALRTGARLADRVRIQNRGHPASEGSNWPRFVFLNRSNRRTSQVGRQRRYPSFRHLHHQSVNMQDGFSIGNYQRGSGCNNLPQLEAARARSRLSRVTACSSNAARSAAPTNAWVGRTQAVGHRVTPFDRINSAIASQSSSDIFPPPSPIAP
jgi:hypothetical protein